MPAFEEPLVMASHLQAIVQDLIATLSGSRREAQPSPESIPERPEAQLLAAIAAKLYADRRRRQEYLPKSLFTEPSWDILLDLYVSKRRNCRVTVTDACIAAAAPSTTALRCLQALEAEGLIERIADFNDRRRIFIQLTVAADDRLTAYLRKLAE